MGAAEVEAFLTYLAVNENVAASTQNQALSALLFLYREVLKKDPGPFSIDKIKEGHQPPSAGPPATPVVDRTGLVCRRAA
jgi:hypothetical protein